MLLIKNGIVHLPNRKIAQSTDILTDGDRISMIKENIIEPKAQVLDVGGLDIYPGLILPLCAVGAMGYADGYDTKDKDEKSSPLTPEVKTCYSFDLQELKRQRFGRAGITSYGLTPGFTNLIAGQMSFVHVDGVRTKDVFIDDTVALKGNFTHHVRETYSARSGPMTHMKMYQMLDESFRNAKEYERNKNAGESDGRNEVIVRMLHREISFFVNAYTQNEIESMIELGKKYRLRMVLCGAFSIDRCAEQIIEEDWDVILGDPTYFMNGISNNIDLEKIVYYYRRGLRLSLGCSGEEGYPPGYEQQMWVAALLRRAGATGEELIDMMTVNPAKALGKEGLVGSLESGKIADIMICKGNPTERYDHYVMHTIVAGRHFYERGDANR